jgi:hypothetical protein
MGIKTRRRDAVTLLNHCLGCFAAVAELQRATRAPLELMTKEKNGMKILFQWVSKRKSWSASTPPALRAAPGGTLLF